MKIQAVDQQSVFLPSSARNQSDGADFKATLDRLDYSRERNTSLERVNSVERSSNHESNRRLESRNRAEPVDNSDSQAHQARNSGVEQTESAERKQSPIESRAESKQKLDGLNEATTDASQQQARPTSEFNTDEHTEKSDLTTDAHRTLLVNQILPDSASLQMNDSKPQTFETVNAEEPLAINVFGGGVDGMSIKDNTLGILDGSFLSSAAGTIADAPVQADDGIVSSVHLSPLLASDTPQMPLSSSATPAEANSAIAGLMSISAAAGNDPASKRSLAAAGFTGLKRAEVGLPAQLTNDGPLSFAARSGAEIADTKQASIGLQTGVNTLGSGALSRADFVPLQDGGLSLQSSLVGDARATDVNSLSEAQRNTTESLAATARTAGSRDAASELPKLPMMVGQSRSAALWGSELASRISVMVRNELQVAELKLNPGSLGVIEVRIRATDDASDISFVVQNPATRDLVEASLPKLKEALLNVGVNLGQADVSDQPKGQKQQPEPSKSDGGTQVAQHDDATGEELVQRASQQPVGLVDTFI